MHRLRQTSRTSGPVPRSELAASEPWLLLDALPEPERFAELLGLVR